MALQKTAVVLFNLGGPDSLQAVRPFLYNLFSDKAIISVPQPFRSMLAWYIAFSRTAKASAMYSRMGGASPINEETAKQAEALETLLNKAYRADAEAGAGAKAEYKVFYSMRYWRPFARDVAKEVKRWQPTSIVLLPLYPQFSTATSASSYKNWLEAAKLAELEVPHEFVCCYPQNHGFIKGYTELTRRVYDEAIRASKPHRKPRLLFSAHGLPMKMIEAGDPYQAQVEAAVQAVVDSLAIPSIDFRVCYQSKVGRLTWLEPSTESEIIRASQDQVPVVVVPISFVSEHVETKVELDIEYKALADKHGVPGYYRVPALSTNQHFIQGLAEMCQNVAASRFSCATCRHPQELSQCPCVGKEKPTET